MLVLTRKPGESVVLGNTVRVTVIELSAGVVRLGFEAPPEVSIYREEIYREIVEANKMAIDESESDSEPEVGLEPPAPKRPSRFKRKGPKRS